MPSIRVYGKHGYNIQFSPFFSRYLACAAAENYGFSGKGSLLILENDNSDRLKVRKCTSWSSGLLDVCWSKINENLILTSSCDGSILLWKVFGNNSNEPLRIFKEHNLDVPSIDSNYNSVASGSWDSTIKIWDLNSVSSVLTLQGDQGIVHSIKWSRTFPNLLLSVSSDCHLALWDKSRPRSSVHAVVPQNSESLDCDWSHHNPYEIAICGSDGIIRIWDIRMLQKSFLNMAGHHKPLSRIKWSPHHSNIIGTTSYNLSTGIWDLKRGGLLETVRHHSAFIFGLDFNKHTCGEIADCGLDSLIHVFTPWSLLEFKCPIFQKNKL